MKPLILPILVTALLHAVVLAAFTAAYHGDPAALVCLGRIYAGREPYEAIHVTIGRDGYDGQFYYALAREPWHAQERGMDVPAYRHKRILYPALAWLLTLGEPHRLLWALPLINLLAITGLGGLGAYLAVRQGLSPWWGVLLPLTVNVGLAALRDLTDPLSTFLVCGLLVGWLVRWPWWNLALWALAACLCREQNVLVAGLLLGVAAWQREKWVSAGLATALGLWSAWIGVVWAMYGTSPFPAMGGMMAWPVVGMIDGLRQGSEFAAWQWKALSFLALATLLVNLMLVLVLLRKRLDPVLRGLLLIGAVGLLVGGSALHVDFWGSQRVFVLLPLGVWLACVRLRRWRPLVPLAAPTLIMLAVVAQAWIKAS
jgi:hypothetical protein